MTLIEKNGEIREASCKEELTAMRESVEILGGKWKLHIMRYLANRPYEKNSFKKMQREIDGISAKMLSKELKDLEVNLLVTRTLLETKPVTVEYQITEYGRGVLPLTETLVSWGLKHRSKIRED